MHRNKRTNHIKNRGSRFLCSSVFCFCIGYIMPLRLCIPLCSSDRRLSNRYLKQQRTHQRAEAISAADRREAAVKKRGCGLKMKILFSGKNAGLPLPPVSAKPRQTQRYAAQPRQPPKTQPLRRAAQPQQQAAQFSDLPQSSGN